MLIDWFTVGAQIVNFLILVGLLRYFLYDRVIAAMDRRKERIEARWKDARQHKKKARQTRRHYRQKQKELDSRRDQIMADARKQAEKRRDELISQARDETDQMRKRWQESVRQEQDNFLKDVRRRVSRGTCSMVRRVLADLADEALERRVIEVFLDRLRSLDEEARNNLGASARDSDGPLMIRSAFEIPQDLRETVSEAIRGSLGDEIPLDFETDPNLICGVEFNADGQRLAWDVEDYLDDLQEQLLDSLDREQSGEEPPAQGDPNPEKRQPEDHEPGAEETEDNEPRDDRSDSRSRPKAVKERG